MTGLAFLEKPVPDPLAGFRQFLEAAGAIPPAEVTADGKWHDCPTTDKPHRRNGRYKLHSDEPVTGLFWNWATGEAFKWRPETGQARGPLSEAERAEIQAAKAKREADQAEAVTKARRYLAGLPPATADNPYLKRKGVAPCPGLLADGDLLVVPVLGTDGAPMSYQAIPPDGIKKRFAFGCPTRDGFFSTGPKGGDGPLLLAEGLATALSCFEATGWPCLVAFNAGNLAAVARMARTRYPARQIVLAADNDTETEARTGKNTGIEAARAAAAAVNGLVAIPPTAGDWNDCHQAQGIAAVKRGIEAALPKEHGGLEFITLGDLLASSEDECLWTVENLLPEGGLSILAGKPKGGKSTLARHEALCVSRGAPFLDRKTMAGPVIYLALEEKRAEVRRHFAAMGATADDPILIYAATAPPEALKALQVSVIRYKPALVIIDPIFRFVRVKDASAYAEVTQALEPLLALARQNSTHVQLVHHARKVGEGADAILGSTALRGAVDCSIIIERNGRQRTISSEQRYGTDLEPAILVMDPETGAVSLGGSKEDFERGQMAAAITEYLGKQSGPVAERTIAEDVEGRTALLRYTLRQMLADGRVERTGDGKKKSPFLYFLPGAKLREQQFENPPEENSCFVVPVKKPFSKEQENNNYKSTETTRKIVVPGGFEKQANREQQSGPCKSREQAFLPPGGLTAVEV